MKRITQFLILVSLVKSTFSEPTKNVLIFQERIKRMMTGRTFDGEIFSKKTSFYVGDCDSGNFGKGSYHDAKMIIKSQVEFDWSRVKFKEKNNYFQVPLKKPRGKDPQYQGARFYFEISNAGRTYWTGYCDQVQYID